MTLQPLILNRDDFIQSMADFAVRPLSADDIPLYQAAYTDKFMMVYISPPLAADKLDASFRLALHYTYQPEPRRLFLVITDNEQKQYYGILGVTVLCKNSRQVEVGIMLLPASQGRRLAEKTLSWLCDKLFSLFDNITIIGKINPAHFVAKKLVARLGFVYCEAAADFKLTKAAFNYQTRKHFNEK